MEISDEELIERLMKYVDLSLDTVYEKDLHLILNKAGTGAGKDEHHHVGERSIVFRFAHYLQNLLDKDDILSRYHLDCEYNRNGALVKSLPSFPNGVYPDVILHKRGKNDSNLMVIEIKTHWNRKQSTDKSKIREFTEKSGKYAFVLGMTILVEKKRDLVHICKYYDGKELNR